MPRDEAPGFDARLRVCRILHLAFVASLVVYVLAVYRLQAAMAAGVSPNLAGLLRWTAYGLGAVVLVVILILKPRFMSAEAWAKSLGGQALRRH